MQTWLVIRVTVTDTEHENEDTEHDSDDGNTDTELEYDGNKLSTARLAVKTPTQPQLNLT